MQKQIVRKAFMQEKQDDGNIKEDVVSVPIPVIRNHFNSRYFQKRGEINDKPSLVIPDQAMSITEMLKRFASGLPLSDGRTPLYDGEEEMTDLERLDLAEREIVLREARNEMSAIAERVNKRRQEAENIRLDKIVAERVQKTLDDRKALEELKAKVEGGIK